MPEFPSPPDAVCQRLREGLVIPAHPLPLDRRRRWNPTTQDRLTHYYLGSGAGGIAVGVHTTQFAIRQPQHALLQPVLERAALTTRAWDRSHPRRPDTVLIAGVCGSTRQATAEAALARDLGYHAGLLSLGALAQATEAQLLAHCHTIARILPLVGFYLQPAVGGRVLPFSFWRRFAEIPSVVAIKVAPFNRYQTLDVVRAVAESGRDDLALYTGNDDAIVADLLTPFRFRVGDVDREMRFVGGLLGQWAVWTRRAVALHAACRRVATSRRPIPAELLRLGAALTDANAAIFDARHGFSGCIPGIHEVLRRQGLMESIACLDPHERLSPGQRAELDRVMHAYPELVDAVE
ncbi:MAG: dihydrodipicolinate synthase family protein [Verrucomicrobiales bacterium]|nr:dihydrodipicolinate synthase family protein [Verrucomicrobiales bacterium]